MYTLVAYDITHPRRLYQVAKVMESYGGRIQRSVFQCDLSEAQFQKLCEELKPLIHQRRDKIRLYRLCQDCQAKNCVCGAAAPFVFVL